LMVEVCLVLAPDVNFFLNSRKQGLPCWRSLSFFLCKLWRSWDKQYHKQSSTDWHSFCNKSKMYPNSHYCACSLSQVRKQLFFPEWHRNHTHVKPLEQIVSMIDKSDTPINFYKVKAHIGVIGSESTDALAKHAALHNNGHDEAFPPPWLDGNPFTHIPYIV